MTVKKNEMNIKLFMNSNSNEIFSNFVVISKKGQGNSKVPRVYESKKIENSFINYPPKKNSFIGEKKNLSQFLKY